MATPFSNVITDIAQLEELYRTPSSGAANKEIAELDKPSRDFISASPFVLVGTSDNDGNGDVSPKGGHPGFVKVIDEKRLVIPDLNGNNRLDSLRNIVTNPHIGLLFLVPERGETLRVNGQAWVTVDDDILDIFTEEYRRPTTAIAVRVDTAYMHCAKCIRRGGLWDPESWAASQDAPTGVDLLAAHLNLDESSKDKLTANLEKSYLHDLETDKPLG
jgi:PPOX class probable FMN-dependent enzyme